MDVCAERRGPLDHFGFHDPACSRPIWRSLLGGPSAAGIVRLGRERRIDRAALLRRLNEQDAPLAKRALIWRGLRVTEERQGPQGASARAPARKGGPDRSGGSDRPGVQGNSARNSGWPASSRISTAEIRETTSAECASGVITLFGDAGHDLASIAAPDRGTTQIEYLSCAP
jgi:hypothetical protein